MENGKLYILSGTTGAGKTELAKAIERLDSRFVRVTKRANRPNRPDESEPDNVYDPKITDLRGNKTNINYHINGNTYCLDIPTIRYELERGKHVIVLMTHNLAIEYMRKLFPETVVIFIHRDLDAKAKETLEERDIKDARKISRILAYDQLISGQFRPDYIIINNTIERIIKQLTLIINHGEIRTPRKAEGRPVLNLILASSGSEKDILLRLVETVPDGSKYLVPKYTTREPFLDDGVETHSVKVLPNGCLAYHLFGHEYGIILAELVERLTAAGTAFVAVSDIPTARQIQQMIEKAGFMVRLVYLHQAPPNLAGYPTAELAIRLQHYEDIVRLYQEDLILHDELPIITADGKESLARWVYSRLLNRV